MTSQTDAASGHSHAPRRFLSWLDAWAIALGCAVGWGAFVMPGSTFLPYAGPLGAIISLVLATLLMVIIAYNFSYMQRHVEGSGGAVTFTEKVFGADHAFLCGWSLGVVYIAIIWANVTAVVFLARYLLGPVLEVGLCYRVAGYSIYLGEMLVTMLILVVFGVLNLFRGDRLRIVYTIMALLMVVGTVGLAVAVYLRSGLSRASYLPAFASETSVLGLLNVIILAPWAFVGFEAVTNSMEEFSFKESRFTSVLIAGVVAGGLIYISTTILAFLVVPERLGSWRDYVASLGKLPGLQALPVFNTVNETFGVTGLNVLCVTVLSAISTSLYGLMRNASKLIKAMAERGMLPDVLAEVDQNGTPRKAVLLVLAVSLLAPFMGRAAIGWIVDVTSVCTSVAYLYVSACIFKLSRGEGGLASITGALGIGIATLFFVLPLVPSVWSVNAFVTESYFILAAWAILGLLIFWNTFRRDETGRFGRSTIMWIAMLVLILFASSMWMRQSADTATAQVVSDMSMYHERQHIAHGVPMTREEYIEESAHVIEVTDWFRSILLNNSHMQMGLIVIALWIMFNIFTLMGRRQAELESKRRSAEETNQAKTMFLSNVSHDLRTPMNAIVGYTRLAQAEDLTLEETRDYLQKIDAASMYMLSLVNDVLEMGRRESGRMVLVPTEVNLLEVVDDVANLFSGQMAEKDIDFTFDSSGIVRPHVRCDRDRLNSVMLNLLSNAYKFTPSGGSVYAQFTELAGGPEGIGRYILRVKDSGIGMSKEFIERLYEPFERERTSTVSGTQGTGLGMSITKSIVDLMGGRIDVKSEAGKGTEFIVQLPLELVGDGRLPDEALAAEDGVDVPVCLAGRRVLMAEDNEINQEIARYVLEDMGLVVDVVSDGTEAVERIETCEPGAYDAVLMDVRMPIMDGYEATRRIRAMADPARSGIPIIAVTANAFDEDMQEAQDAGMTAFLTKPLDIERVGHVLCETLRQQQ